MICKMNLFGLNSKDIGIDLGTSNILVTIKGKGVVLKEPAVVATDIKTGNILATGYEAKEMLGRTPETIRAVRPMNDGVIADYTATRLLLKNILNRKIKNNLYKLSLPFKIWHKKTKLDKLNENVIKLQNNFRKKLSKDYTNKLRTANKFMNLVNNIKTKSEGFKYSE